MSRTSAISAAAPGLIWEPTEETVPVAPQIALLRAALVRDPENDSTRLKLAAALVKDEQLEAARAVLDEVDPGKSLQTDLMLADTLLRLRDTDAALARCDAILAAHPQCAEALGARLDALARKGKVAAAEIESEAAVRAVLDRAGLLDTLVRASRSAEARERLLRLCERVRLADPLHTDAVYVKAMTLARLGKGGQARRTISTRRGVDVRQLRKPAGYRSATAFLEALKAEILANPTLRPDPRGKATRAGLQTQTLWQPDCVALPALYEALQDAVTAYVGRNSWLSSGGRPRSVRLQAWAVVYGSEGRQISHRHPGGWISGVFYVAGPRDEATGGYGAPLRLGEIDETFAPPWGVRDIEPRPGRLVLFPSWTPHATAPNNTRDQRICVAFDVRIAD